MLAEAVMLAESAASSRRQRTLEWALVGGLIAIFLANAIGAVLEPASYRHILEASPVSRLAGLHRHAWATTMIAVNDGAIAAGLIVSLFVGRARRMMAVAGMWLAIAAALKITACIW